MSNASDFVIENGVLTKYKGFGGKVIIPEEVRKIGERAFAYRAVSSVEIPGTVEEIGPFAFEHCTGLKEVILHEGIRVIGHGAFSECANLEEVQIPDSVQELGNNVFILRRKMRQLQALGVTESGEQYLHDQPVILPQVPISSIKGADSKLGLALGYFSCPEKYSTEIAADYHKFAFSQKKKILAIAWKQDLVNIVAFYAEQKKISVANIEKDFLNPAMEANAKQCIAYLLEWKEKNLKAASPAAKMAKELEKSPVSATELKKVWNYAKNADGGLKITGYKGSDPDVVIPQTVGKDTVTVLGYECFCPVASRLPDGQFEVRKKIESVEIPDTVTKISERAFFACESLKQVMLPKSLKCIESDAFCRCPLESVEIPDGTETIMELAFSRCSELQRIHIPASVQEIGHSAINRCPKVTIYAPAGSYAETYAKENNIPFVAE